MAKKSCVCPAMTINGNKLGLALGGTLVVVHLIWALMVKLGLAAKFLDWILMLHFIKCPMAIAPFSIGNAVFLLIMAFLAGYVIGWVFALLWHCVEHKCRM